MDSYTRLRACADGGTLGPKGGHRPNFEIQIQIGRLVSEGLDTFAAPSSRLFKFCPGLPSRRLHRRGSQQTPAEDTRSGVSRGKRVPQPGGSECNYQVKSAGPRRYRWREYIRWRCLTDVADDGACIVCFNFFINNSRLKSPPSSRIGRFLGRVRGELLVAALHPKIDSNTGQKSRNCCFGCFFLYVLVSLKIRCVGSDSVR